MIKKCNNCGKGNIDYSMSEVHLIPDTDPQEAGIEGICDECNTYFYVKFKQYQTEITRFDESMQEIGDVILMEN